MTATLKTLLPLFVLGFATAMICGCCCGGSSSSTSDFDWGDYDSTSGDVGTFAKSCNDSASLSQCSEHTDNSMSLLGEDFYKSICELTDGKWTTDHCSTAAVVGKCDDGVGTTTFYYSDGGSPYTKETAKSNCSDMLGTFKE